MNIFKKFSFQTISFTLLWGVLLAVLIFGFSWFQNAVNAEQLDLVKNSVHRAAVQCYALEGFYPSSLDYLVDNYGFEYNDGYLIDYQYIGSNLIPEIFVIPKK